MILPSCHHDQDQLLRRRCGFVFISINNFSRSFLAYVISWQTSFLVQQGMSLEDDLAGFSVAPKSDCPHIADPTFRVDPSLVPSQQDPPPSEKGSASRLYEQHRACADCGDTSETWVCLYCARDGCGRYLNAHMAMHAVEQTERGADGHVVIAFGLADLSTWCFLCDSYITHPKVEPVFREMHFAKFGQWPAAPFHVAAERSESSGIVLEVTK